MVIKDVKILCFDNINEAERVRRAEATLKEYLQLGYKITGVGSNEFGSEMDGITTTQVCTILIKEE